MLTETEKGMLEKIADMKEGEAEGAVNVRIDGKKVLRNSTDTIRIESKEDKDGIDIYCFERGHLLLANSFECTHTEDRIYYLLYAWKQLEFNQERDELHLTGILPEKDVLMSELKKFILQVFIMNPATNIDMQALLTCE